MARSIQRLPGQVGRVHVTTALLLAWWQFRLTWRLMLLVAVGGVAAVMLVCTVPLYSQVTQSAGLRDALSAPGASTITVHSVAHLISSSATEKLAEQIQQEVVQDVGPFLGDAQFSAQSPALTLTQDKLLQLIGWSISDMGSHVQLLAGHLPQNGGKVLEIALTPQSARELNTRVGDTFEVSLPFLDSLDNQVFFSLSLRVSGIFQPALPRENYWHGTAFAPQKLDQFGTLYPLLVSNNSYLTALARASLSVSHGNFQAGMSFENPTDLYWYYNLDLAHLDSYHSNELSSGLNTLLTTLSNQPVELPYVDRTTSSGPADLLNRYSDRVAAVNAPLLCIVALLAALLLFYIYLLSGLLADYQARDLTLWRNRGASREQLFSVLLVQSIWIGLFSLLLGSILALGLTWLLASTFLSASAQNALNVFLTHPFSTGLRSGLAALAMACLCMLAMSFASYQTMRAHLRLSTKKAEPGHAWLRLSLHLLLGLLTLLGYALSAYVAMPGILDLHTRALALPSVTLLGSLCLFAGGLWIIMRLLPAVLTLITHLSTRGRGVLALLSMTNMTHAPRQSFKMLLFLALAIAFGVFSQICAHSQNQRISAVAAYQVGADVSGTYAPDAPLRLKPLAQQEAAFMNIKSVDNVCIGYMASTRGAQGSLNAPIELRAVDADTFASTATWTSQDASQPLSPLMRQLVKQRSLALDTLVVPAIVDEAAWKTLNLTSDSPFTLSDLNGSINYIEIAKVDHLPTINDNPYASGTNDYVPLGGVLVDFATYQAVLQRATQTNTPLAPDTVWLKTKTDAHSLATVRSALASGPLQLFNVKDVSTQAQAMRNDPLGQMLPGIAQAGALIVLALGLLGNLTISWWHARKRVKHFAVMRALGTVPQKLIIAFTAEQTIVYLAAAALGVGYGLVLAYLVGPTCIFTSPVGKMSVETGVFYSMQSVPPVQLIVPGTLIALILSSLMVFCIVIVSMMARYVTGSVTQHPFYLPGDS